MLTLQEIHRAIMNLSDQLEELVTEIAKAADQAAEEEASFKYEFAAHRIAVRNQAIDLKAKLTVDAVEDAATVATAKNRREYLTAANHLTVLREALRARQAQLDGLRSLLSSFKTAGG